MLRSAKDFAALQQSRRLRSEPLLTVRWAANGLDHCRFGFATSRKVGGAVVRNRVRRRLREIVRALEPRLAPGWDVLVVVRRPGAGASSAELRTSLERALKSARLLQGEGNRG